MLVLAPAARAQDGTHEAGALILEAPASTEAMALGNVPYLFTEESGLLFYTPALLSQGSGASAAIQRYGSEGTLLTLSGAGSFQGGGFAVGLQSLRYQQESGVVAGRDSQGRALHPGDLGVSELAGTIGYGHSLFGFEAGAALKYIEQSINETNDATFALDVGIARDLGPAMVSVVARNLGPDLELMGPTCTACDTSGVPRALELPSQIGAGLSLERFEVGELDMFVTGQIMRRRDGEWIPAGGLELSYWPVQGYTFRLRSGVQRVSGDHRSPFTFGAAFTGDAITIGYAFQSFDGEGNAHRFGLTWH